MSVCVKYILIHSDKCNEYSHADVLTIFDVNQISYDEIDVPNGRKCKHRWYFPGDGNNVVREDAWGKYIKQYSVDDMEYYVDNVKEKSFGYLGWIQIQLIKKAIEIIKKEFSGKEKEFSFLRYFY